MLKSPFLKLFVAHEETALYRDATVVLCVLIRHTLAVAKICMPTKMRHDEHTVRHSFVLTDAMLC